MIDFPKYLRYLDTIKDSLPEYLYDFARNENRHNLTSPHSLHDAWIASISVKENRNKTRPFAPMVTIEISLLGPMHDRDIVLSYADVRAYSIVGKQNTFNYGDTFHGDIQRHEIRLSGESYQHVIWLDSKSHIEIDFKHFEIKEILHKPIQ